MSARKTTPEFEPHHVFYEKKAWNVGDESALLRAEPGLIVPMFVAPHDELHRQVPFVPLMDEIQCFHIRRELGPLHRATPLDNIQRLIEAIDRTTEVFAHDVIRTGLAKLAILAIEKQVPFIRDGLYVRALPPKPRRQRIDGRKGGRVL